MAERALN